MIKCKQCGAEVPQTSKRKRFYCSDKCRMAFKRSNNEQLSTPITNKPITNTPTADIKPKQTQPGHIYGTCYGCGEKQPNPLTDICFKCIAKGMTRATLGLPAGQI